TNDPDPFALAEGQGWQQKLHGLICKSMMFHGSILFSSLVFCICCYASGFSSKIAEPCPPAAQPETTAKRCPSCCKRLAAVRSKRPPVAPKGWPMDKDPPQTL